MSLYNSFDRSKHFSELGTPLDTAGGVLSPFTRRARAAQNLGMQLSAGAGRFVMPVPATATNTATLTTAQVSNGLILGTPTAAASYTLPTGAALDALGLDVGEAFECIIVNLATTAAFDITVVTNTGLTLVGELVIEADEATQLLPSQGRFWFRKTGSAAYSVYRVGS